MSGVVGIDIGSADSIVASVGRGMVDIVRNEVSERVTPSVVGFSHRSRLLGEAAVSLIKSNYANTCRFPKLLLGKKLSDPDMDEERFFQLCKLETAKDGSVGYAVNYLEQERVFSATEITAMLLTKLKDTTLNFTGAVPKDAVIACPSYFTDIQRRALLDAAEIAGIKPLKIMNDTSATALGYGIYRSNEFDEKVPTNVAFVSVGHSHFTCSIASFTKHQLTVLAECTDRTVGGRNVERLLMEHFAGIFQKKNNGLDPLASAKTRYKIEEAVAKMKKILSANSEAAINIECLMEERDLNAVVSRSDLESMCEPMLPRMLAVIEKTIRASGFTADEIACVEIVGGCSRMPFIQAAVSQAFGGKELSRTLNADECVARGCALQAAILSPLFKVRDFNVIDSTAHPISISWISTGATHEGDDTDMADDAVTQSTASTKSAIVFARKSPINVTKVLTFYRNGPFDISAEYADPDMLPVGTSPLLGKYHVAIPHSETNRKVKVRARLSIHGTFSIESAHLIETEEYDEVVKERVPKVKKEGSDETSMQTEEQEFEEVETVHKKKRDKKTELHITASSTNGLTHESLQSALDAESVMNSIDREARDRDNARNDLESYIYDVREKLSGAWAAYVANEAEKDSLMSEITAAEDWIYDKFEDGTKVEFADKLVELSGKMSVVKGRLDEVIRQEEAAAAAAKAAAEKQQAEEAAPATQTDVPMNEESSKVDEMD